MTKQRDIQSEFPNLLAEPWQACALSLDIDPDTMVPERNDYLVGPGVSAMYGPQPSELKVTTLVEFKKREQLLGRHLGDSHFFTVVDGKIPLWQFVDWLRAMEIIHIPLALAELRPTPEDQAKWNEINDWLDESPDLARRASNGSPVEIHARVQAAADSVATRLREQSESLKERAPKSLETADPLESVGLRIPVGRQQEAAIIAEINARKLDPKAFPRNPDGKAEHKAEIRNHLCKIFPQLFVSRGVFDAAWERLRKSQEIKNEEV